MIKDVCICAVVTLAVAILLFNIYVMAGPVAAAVVAALVPIGWYWGAFERWLGRNRL